MPTGSNRTWCFSPIALPRGLSWAGGRGGGPGGTRPSPSPDPRSGARGGGRPAGRALAVVVGDERRPLLVGHLVEQDVRAQQRTEPLEVLGRPHLLRVEVQMRLRRHRLPVVPDEAHVLNDLVPGPAVVEGLPLAVAHQPAHVRGLAALVDRAEGLDVGPAAGLAAVGPVHAVDLGRAHVLADEAGHHADPAALRVHVVDVLTDDRLVPVGHRQAAVVLPPLAVLVVPARVLVLEPLEVLVGHRVDAPVVGAPPGGEELRALVDVALVPDPVPGLLDEVVRDGEAVLLERDQVAAVVVVVDPATPHLRIGLPVLAAVLGAVLDEDADRGVHHRVVVSPRVAPVALEQLPVALVGERHEQGRVPVGDVPRLVGLHRVEDRRQQVVAVGRRLGGHGHEQRVREGGLRDDGEVDAGGGDRVPGDEPLGELAADGAGVVVVEVPQAVVEARGVDVVLHVQALEVLLDRRVPDLVDHLDRLAVVQFRVGNGVEQHRHRAGGRDLGQRDDRQEELLPLQPALLHLAEHVAADRAVLRAVDPVVLLLLHREVRPEDLLERVLLLGFPEGVVGAVLHVRLVIHRLPGQFLDLLVGLRQALSTHVDSSRLGSGTRSVPATSRRRAPTGRAAARARFLGSRDGRGRRGPQRRRGARRGAPTTAFLVIEITAEGPAVGGLNMRRGEISLFLLLVSLELLAWVSPSGARQRRSVPQRRGRGRVSVSKRAGAKPAPRPPAIELPSPGGGPEIARARTLFLVDEPLVPGVVREPILASWTRSRLWEIRPDHLDLPFEPGADDDTLLTRAAEPVLREVADLFATEPVSVILCDADGVVLSRRTGDRGLEQHLNRVWLAPGFSYAEQFVGTNGIGTALEARGPARGFGHEHYVERLEGLACAGGPVRPPVDRQGGGGGRLTWWARGPR